MVPSPLAVFGAAMAAICAVIFLVSARYAWRASALLRADAVTTLAGADSGSLVRVEGTVERDADPLVAPFSGAECVALREQVEERRLSVPTVLPWYVTLSETTGGVSFAVNTGRDTVGVTSPTHTVALETRVVATVAPGTDPPERIARFERETEPVPTTTFWQDPPWLLAGLFDALSLGVRRYTEQRADLGDAVTVVGRVTDEGVDSLVLSDRSPTRTLVRMAGVSLAGLGVGVLAVPIVRFAVLG